MSEARLQILFGDCLKVMATLPDGIADVVVADPPYSSGGLFRGDRMATTDTKYVNTEQSGNRPSFTGDNRDQRSWAYWCHLWMSEARRVARPGAYFLCFADWRQLPTATDAVQAAGWLWRGVIVWDKTEGARMASPNHFRHQCEYVVWASNGPLPEEQIGPWPGCFRFPVKQSDKYHQAGKPTPLFRELVKCCPPGGLVLDPFAGSGVAGVACAEERRRYIGIEMDEGYYRVAKRRVEEALAPPLFAQAVIGGEG